MDEFIYCKDDIKTRKISGLRWQNTDKSIAFALPDGVEEITPSAFMGCKATAFLLPESLKKIRAMAFYGCNGLRAVFIPKGVEVIGNGAFEYSPNVEIYCEGEPQKGWVAEEPKYRTERVTTDDDYAFDFHRGGVSYTTVRVRTSKHWNPDGRPVHTNCSREEFVKKFFANIT